MEIKYFFTGVKIGRYMSIQKERRAPFFLYTYVDFPPNTAPIPPQQKLYPCPLSKSRVA